MIKIVIFDYFGVIWVGLRPKKKMRTVAEDLRAQGFETPILSNVIKPIGWGLQAFGAYKDLDPVFLSEEIGTDKPGPEIYKIVLGSLNHKPNECIFIDNRPENLVEPKSMGVHVVLAKKTDQVIAEIRDIINK